MITRVRARNFRSLADVDVTLGPLTVLVGKNGTGKSAFVDVLRFTRDMLRDDLGKALAKRQGYFSLRYSSIEDSPIEICIEMNSKAEDFSGSFAFSVADNGIIFEHGRLDIPKISYSEKYKIDSGRWSENPRDSPFRPDVTTLLTTTGLDLLASASTQWLTLAIYLYGIEIFSVSPEMLRSRQFIQTSTWANDDGRNFATLLRSIIEIEENKYALLSFLRLIVETIKDIRVTETAGNLIPELQHVDGAWRNLENESDGTVRLLGILCVLNGIRVAPGLAGKPLIIEEPEISIYPEYLELIANVIREASKTRQIIITTQSPDLISCLPPTKFVLWKAWMDKRRLGRSESINARLWIRNYSNWVIY